MTPQLDLTNILLSIVGFLIAFFIYELKDLVKQAIKSVDELNVKVAIIIERTEKHDDEIDGLRTRQHELANGLARVEAKLGEK